MATHGWAAGILNCSNYALLTQTHISSLQPTPSSCPIILKGSLLQMANCLTFPRASVYIVVGTTSNQVRVYLHSSSWQHPNPYIAVL